MYQTFRRPKLAAFRESALRRGKEAESCIDRVLPDFACRSRGY